MKLLWFLFGLLAVSLADDKPEVKPIENEEDLEAAASMELLKTDQESLETAASAYAYVPPSQRPPKDWSVQNYVPTQEQVQNYQQNPVNYIPQNTWTPPNNTPPPPPPVNNYYPQNNWPAPVPNPPQWKPPTGGNPQNNYIPSAPAPPVWNPPQKPGNPPYVPPQNDYYVPPKPSTTPSSVIKNDQYIGDNGSYKYEYKITDGTHVGEEGYVVNPNTEQQSVVKKGWYSYTGADGKVYTVTWWADDSGFHAFGDHLPTPPPVPAAIQAAIDQAAKEEAAKAEAEKNKPPVYYPPSNQQTYYPPNQQTYPQQTYPQNQQTYYPNQPTYNPPTYGK